MKGTKFFRRFIGVGEIYGQHELYLGSRVNVIEKGVSIMLFDFDEFDLPRDQPILGHTDNLTRILHHLREGHLQLTQHGGPLALAELFNLYLELRVFIITKLGPGEVKYVPLYERFLDVLQRLALVDRHPILDLREVVDLELYIPLTSEPSGCNVEQRLVVAYIILNSAYVHDAVTFT